MLVIYFVSVFAYFVLVWLNYKEAYPMKEVTFGLVIVGFFPYINTIATMLFMLELHLVKKANTPEARERRRKETIDEMKRRNII